jgi:hypothetical protein
MAATAASYPRRVGKTHKTNVARGSPESARSPRSRGQAQVARMDSHHDMVQRERDAAANAPAVKYFAYSTILDRAAFEEWRDQHGYGGFQLPTGQLARADGIGLVYDFPSRWWGGRVAGLEDRAGAHVFGLLFEIPGIDWPIVRHKEGAITGMAVERAVRITTLAGPGGGAAVDALAFTTAPARARKDGPVSERFAEALVRGARAAGLPESWLGELAAGAR